MTEVKLLKRLTLKMEEHGMPKFKDKCPAMDVLKIVKDNGYSKYPFWVKPSVKDLEEILNSFNISDSKIIAKGIYDSI